MSIRKRNSKKASTGYTYQVYFNYFDPTSNTTKVFSKSGFLTREDAELYEKKKKLEFDSIQMYIKQYKVTLHELFDEWLEIEGKFLYQDNSIIDYQNRFKKHIEPRLGSFLVSDIDYKILQTYFNNNKEIGLATNFKLKEIFNVLLNFAIKCDYRHDNPMRYVRVIGNDNNRSHLSKVYKDEDFKRIILYLSANSSPIRQAYIVALYIGKYTGLRISEVFALDRCDFNFLSEQIYVNKKMVYANKKRDELYTCSQLKSKTSKTILPFHKELQNVISQWLNIHPFTHIVSDDKGQYINPKQLEYTLWKISKELNINFNFHMLRHTLASKLVNNGANLKAAQEILRHANISTTMNIYTHINHENKSEALYKAFPIENQDTLK